MEKSASLAGVSSLYPHSLLGGYSGAVVKSGDCKDGGLFMFEHAGSVVEI